MDSRSGQFGDGQRDPLDPSFPVRVRVRVSEGEELVTQTQTRLLLDPVPGILIVDDEGTCWIQHNNDNVDDTTMRSRVEDDTIWDGIQFWDGALEDWTSPPLNTTIYLEERVDNYSECVVTFPYKARGDGELTLWRGALITEVVEKKGGWWEGQLGGKTGMFPFNFAVKVPFPPRRFKAVFSYRPSNNDELLAFSAGDVVEYLEDVGEGWCRGRNRFTVGLFHPIFFVESSERAGWALCVPVPALNGHLDMDGGCADSPLEIYVIFAKILTYLPIQDLKSVRLVCKRWGKEGTFPLEKRGLLSFSFFNLNKDSSRVSRYLVEMGNMKMRNLKIVLRLDETCEEEFRQKVIFDLGKLLNSSHAFTSLLLEADVRKAPDFPPFLFILTELAGKLVELTLTGDLKFLPDPESLLTLPVFPQLRKFHDRTYAHRGDGDNDKARWASFLVPLFSRTLEVLECFDRNADVYLTAFITAQEAMPMPMPMSQLTALAFKTDGFRMESLPLLLQLKISLSSLKFSCYLEDEEVIRVLETLLYKHSQTLEKLAISIWNDDPPATINIKFPKFFPRLEEFSLEYYGGLRGVSFERWAELDYEEQFPSLRKLRIISRGLELGEDPVFNTFFPLEERDLVCKTVEVLDARLHLFGPRDPPLITDPFQQRVNKIKRIFPAAFNKAFL